MLNGCAGGKRAKGRGGSGRGGGGGRGVRGVDFGLGIGYSPDSDNTSSNATPSRAAAVSSLRTGMMAQFKSNFVAASSNFVAASSNTPNQDTSNSSGTHANTRMVLPGFVSGGSIGGEISASKTTSYNPPSMGVNPTKQSSKENTTQKNSERYTFLAPEKI